MIYISVFQEDFDRQVTAFGALIAGNAEVFLNSLNRLSMLPVIGAPAFNQPGGEVCKYQDFNAAGFSSTVEACVTVAHIRDEMKAVLGSKYILKEACSPHLKSQSVCFVQLIFSMHQRPVLTHPHRCNQAILSARQRGDEHGYSKSKQPVGRNLCEICQILLNEAVVEDQNRWLFHCELEPPYSFDMLHLLVLN